MQTVNVSRPRPEDEYAISTTKIYATDYFKIQRSRPEKDDGKTQQCLQSIFTGVSSFAATCLEFSRRLAPTGNYEEA